MPGTATLEPETVVKEAPVVVEEMLRQLEEQAQKLGMSKEHFVEIQIIGTCPIQLLVRIECFKRWIDRHTA